MPASKLQNDCLHHSRHARYRHPLGACPAGETLTLRIELFGALRHAAPIIKVSFCEKERLIPMTVVEQTPNSTLFEGHIDLTKRMTGLLFYSFLINNGKRLFFYHGVSGRGTLSAVESAQRYQVTVYDGAFRTPSWPKRSIMYHIFVDRFARSSARGGLERLRYHSDLRRNVYRHENWDEQPLYLPHDGAEHYLPDDFFGGDLEGIRQKLPYLKELGVGALFLSPIFESYSNHKYDTSDYMKIDPAFGDEEEFRALCADARALGMHIMLDGVFSHTGADSIYFNREGRYGASGAYRDPKSPYTPWYHFHDYPRGYESWWGFESMPNVDEMNPSYLDFITGEHGVIRHWLSAGASAWRLDVADELPDAFIVQLRNACKQEGEENMLLGEVWEDASNKFSSSEQRQYVMGHELDSVMNYPLREAILSFLLGRGDSRQMTEKIHVLRERYPLEFFYCCLNLISSHDVPRALSLLGGAPDKDSGVPREKQAGFRLSASSRKTARVRLQLATLIQMCLPGCPCVYYGDEAGSEGLMDPFNRGTFPWGREDIDLQQHFRRIMGFRNAHDALQTGGMLLYAPTPDVLAIVRFVENGRDAFGDPAHDGTFIALINRANAHQSARVSFRTYEEGPDAAHWTRRDGQYTDLFSGQKHSCNDQILTVSLPPLGYLLLKDGNA